MNRMRNCITGGKSFIGGGANNTISGQYSSILGGSGNSDGGLTNVHIAGSGITAAANNTFYANCLNAKDTPSYPGFYPTGTVSYYLVTSSFPSGITPGMKLLVIS